MLVDDLRYCLGRRMILLDIHDRTEVEIVNHWLWVTIFILRLNLNQRFLASHSFAEAFVFDQGTSLGDFAVSVDAANSLLL